MSALLPIILAEIDAHGPMPLERYMDLCLSHPEHGYYRQAEPFGRDGDFITAPEISQMFGELIGLWIGDLWTRQGQPASPMLVELGPGRGTLMADICRAMRKVPGWPDADIHFVETSPRLRALQAEKHPSANWHDSVASIPSGRPLYIIANELFDALPIRQAVKTATGWAQRAVTQKENKLTYTVLECAPDPGLPDDAVEGDIYELCPAGTNLAHALGQRVAADGGGGLIVDYGYTSTAAGDSFQAVRQHAYTDPLEAPGEADVTAHVNFASLAGAATSAGCAVYGPTTQDAFLGQLGLPIRARALGGPALRDAARLMDKDAMGGLFKALAFTPPGSPQPAGFGP